MKVGYLHLGPPEHGISRYGRYIAKAASGRQGLYILEAEVIFTRNRKHNRFELINAAKKLSGADIIHFQYNKGIWSGGWTQLYYLRVFINMCKCPLVVTFHDVYPKLKFSAELKNYFAKYFNKIRYDRKVDVGIFDQFINYKQTNQSSVYRIIESIINFTTLATRWLVKKATLIFACSDEEKYRIISLKENKKIKVIPHFVEKRSILITQSTAKKALKLNDAKILVLLGYIHNHDRKGHGIMLDALSYLSKDIKLIFAGGPSPGSEEFVETLKKKAKDKKIDNRFSITGFLSENKLEKYLVAADLAVCPFRTFSASGSLSTWISVARPILASDNPQIQEYNLLEPEAIKIFKPYSAVALAKKIEQILPSCNSRPDLAVNRLRKKLSISNIFEQHLELYNLAINQV
jgi:hypothetical protein